MRVKWLRKALADLDTAARHIARHKPSAARAMVVEAFRITDLSTEQPDLGRPGWVPGTRELVMGHYPYLIPYRVRGGSVEVLRVFHAARRWPNAL